MPQQKTKAGRKRARANLKAPWQRGQSGNPNGRPRKVLTELAAKVGVDFQVSLSKEDKFSILESMLEMSLQELKSIATDKAAPAFMVVVASAIRKDIQSGKMYTLNDLFDRFFGRPDQVSKVELANKAGESLKINTEMSDNELDERLNHLERVLSTEKGKGKTAK